MQKEVQMWKERLRSEAHMKPSQLKSLTLETPVQTVHKSKTPSIVRLAKSKQSLSRIPRLTNHIVF